MIGDNLGFSGEVADLYHKYRHGYPDEVLDCLADAFGLDHDDVVVDLGCGTGQLSLPMAHRVRAVIGIDPEPDMLDRARRAARDDRVDNVGWMLGSDSDIPALRRLLGECSVGAVTVGQALHWMDHRVLFEGIGPLLRRGGGVAVVTNGTPLWLQDSPWSRGLRSFLERWFATEIFSACGTDEQSQQRHRGDLAAAGFDVSVSSVDHVVELDLDHLVGAIYSALPVVRLPSLDRRSSFVEQIRLAVAPDDHFLEQVHVGIVIGRCS